MKTLRFREVKQLVQHHTVSCQSRGQSCHFGTSVPTLPPWGPSLPRTSSQGIFSARFSQLSSLKCGMTKLSLECRLLRKCRRPLVPSHHPSARALDLLYGRSQKKGQIPGNFMPPVLSQLQNLPCCELCFDFRHFMGMKSKPWSFWRYGAPEGWGDLVGSLDRPTGQGAGL